MYTLLQSSQYCRKPAIILLEDKHGSLTNNIEAAHRSDPNRITLQKWLEKTPRNWSELVAALRTIEHGALANDLEEYLIR